MSLDKRAGFFGGSAFCLAVLSSYDASSVTEEGQRHGQQSKSVSGVGAKCRRLLHTGQICYIINNRYLISVAVY